MTPARTALWRTELEAWQVSAIEAVAGDRMEQFGYERQARVAAGMSRASLEALVEMTFQKFFRSPSAFYHFLQPTNLADEEKWQKRATAMYGRLRSRPPRLLNGHRFGNEPRETLSRTAGSDPGVKPDAEHRI